MLFCTFERRSYCPADGFRPFCNVVPGMTDLSRLKERLLNEKNVKMRISVSEEMEGVSKKLILA